MESRILLVLFVITIMYTVLGGVAFHYLESTAEIETHARTFQYQTDFLENYTCVSKEDLKQLINIIVEAYAHGIIATNSTNTDYNWNLINSMFFASTVITTIGYGHLAPATGTGQAVCVLYAIFGIPLTLVFLSGLGERVVKFYDNLIGRCLKKQHKSKMSKLIRFVIVFLLGCVFLVFIPSGIFSAKEGWGYGTSLYFSMITLSTIGFGDYLIGKGFTSWPASDIYRLAVASWIILGLSWFATCISTAQDFLQHTADRFGEKDEKEDNSLKDDPEEESVTNL